MSGLGSLEMSAVVATLTSHRLASVGSVSDSQRLTIWHKMKNHLNRSA